jgi:hypothetical protein
MKVRRCVRPINFVDATTTWADTETAHPLTELEFLEGNKYSKCLMPFGSESFVFLSPIYKCRDENIKHNKFTCPFVWV